MQDPYIVSSNNPIVNSLEEHEGFDQTRKPNSTLLQGLTELPSFWSKPCPEASWKHAISTLASIASQVNVSRNIGIRRLSSMSSFARTIATHAFFAAVSLDTRHGMRIPRDCLGLQWRPFGFLARCSRHGEAVRRAKRPTLWVQSNLSAIPEGELIGSHLVGRSFVMLIQVKRLAHLRQMSRTCRLGSC